MKKIFNLFILIFLFSFNIYGLDLTFADIKTDSEILNLLSLAKQDTELLTKEQYTDYYKFKINVRQKISDLYNNKNYDTVIQVLNEIRPYYFETYELTLAILSYYNLEKYEQVKQIYEQYDYLNIEKKYIEYYNKSLEKIADRENELQLQKFRELFSKAETLYNYEDYEEALKYYNQALEIIPDANLYEVNTSKQRIKQIQNKLEYRKITDLKQKIINSENTEQLDLIADFYKKYYEDSIKNDKSLVLNYLISNLSTKNYEFVEEYYNRIKDYISVSEKEKIFVFLINKSFETNKIDKVKFYLDKLNSIGIDAENQYTEFYLKLDKIESYFYLKILFLLIFFILIVLMYIYRKKFNYLFLKIKVNYYKNIDDRFNLLDSYHEILNYNVNDKILIEMLELYFEVKSEKEIINLFKKITDIKEINKKRIFDILKILMKYDNKIEFNNLVTKINSDLSFSEQEKIKLYNLEYTAYIKFEQYNKALKLGDKILNKNFDPKFMRKYINLLLETNNINVIYKYLRLWLRNQPYAIRSITEFTENLVNKINLIDVKIYNFLGVLYRKLEEDEKAIEIYEFLEDKFDNKLPIYNNLYNLYKKNNDVKNEIRILEKIIDLRAENIQDKLELGKLYFSSAKYEEAEKYLKNVLKRDHNNLTSVNFLNQIAEYYKNNDKIEKAIEVYNDIIKFSVYDTSSSKIKLASIYKNLKEYDKAISVLQKIVSGEPEIVIKSKLLLAECLIKRNDIKMAEGILNQINENDININSENKKYICYYKAVCYELMKNYDKAKEYYQYVILHDINFKDANSRYQRLLGIKK